MKKLYKKQKLIGFIALLIVAIILAMVITTNIISKNHQVASQEDYLATTANANSNLVASYIKEGITIGGITGTLEILDTSDANATPEDIIWGKTGYVKGKKITGTYVDTVSLAKESGKCFDENTDLIDDYGNRVKVPAGFKVAEDSATSVTGGVVIEDVTAGDNNTKGSQFVWVPVGDVLTDNNGNKTTITLGRYTFDNNGKETLVQSAENWSDTSNNVAIGGVFKELANSSYGNATAKNLEQFIAKTTKTGGYYIGRYEAGDVTATISPRNNNSDDNNPVTCKKGVYPYNYITQLQASSLCRGMYNSNNFSSDLINSYSWLTAIVFIQKFSGDQNYSRQNGTNTARSVQKVGESNLLNLDNGDKQADIRCNICDMAGNTSEWTTQTCSDTSFPCVNIGGYCNSNISYATWVSSGALTTSEEYGNNSARPILYL